MYQFPKIEIFFETKIYFFYIVEDIEKCCTFALANLE